MNLQQAIKRIEETIPHVATGDVWLVLSRDGGQHCTLTNVASPQDSGYACRDVMYVYEERKERSKR